MLNYLFHSHVGFAWGIRILAFISLGCFIVGNFLIYPPKQRSNESTRNQPSPTAVVKPPAFQLDTPYLLILASGFLWSLGANTPNFYMQLFARQHGVDQTLIFNSFSILSLASIFGRIVPGWMADRWGAARVYVPTVFVIGMYPICFGLLNKASNNATSRLAHGRSIGVRERPGIGYICNTVRSLRLTTCAFL